MAFAARCATIGLGDANVTSTRRLFLMGATVSPARKRRIAPASAVSSPVPSDTPVRPDRRQRIGSRRGGRGGGPSLRVRERGIRDEVRLLQGLLHERTAREQAVLRLVVVERPPVGLHHVFEGTMLGLSASMSISAVAS